MAWLPCRESIQVLCGCSACAGRAAVELARARQCHSSPELGPTNLLCCPSTAPGVVAGATLSVLQVEATGREDLAGRAEARRGACTTGDRPRRPVRPPRVPTWVPRAAGLPCMSSQPRAWSIHGQWGRWGGGGSGNRQCPGSPLTLLYPILCTVLTRLLSDPNPHCPSPNGA